MKLGWRIREMALTAVPADGVSQGPGSGGEAAGISLGNPGHVHGTVALPCCDCMGSVQLGFLEKMSF